MYPYLSRATKSTDDPSAQTTGRVRVRMASSPTRMVDLGKITCDEDNRAQEPFARMAFR
jgi:hypothetical protein